VALLSGALRQVDLRNRRVLLSFDQFLADWIDIAAWADAPGLLGQTATAKLRLVLAQLRHDYLSIPSLAGSITSGLYSDGALPAARRWYQLYRHGGERPSMLGPIALAQGDYCEARRCFRHVLADPEISGPSFALHTSYHALSLMGCGRRTQADLLSQRALEVDALPDDVRTRVWRSRALVLLGLRGLPEALDAIDVALALAARSSLTSQVRKARQVKRRIALALRRG
jgi:hypothetical protein